MAQKSSVVIPKWLKKDVKPLYTQAAKIGGQIGSQSYSKYGGPRVAGINPAMRTAMTNIQNQGQNPMLSASKGYTSDVLSGKYMKGNPYLDDVINKSGRDITSNFQKNVQPQVQANLARQGAFGGSGWAQANRDINQDFSQQLADMTSGLRYQDYGQERGYMDQASGRAADLANIDMSNAQAALSAGDLERGINQQQIDADYGDFTEERDWLFRALQGIQGGLSPQTQMYGQRASGGGSGGSALGSVAQLMGGAGSMMSGYGAMTAKPAAG